MPAAKVATITAEPWRCAARYAARSALNTWSSLPVSSVLRLATRTEQPSARAASMASRMAGPMSSCLSG